MNDNAKEKIDVGCELFSPVSKIDALSQLFDCVAADYAANGRDHRSRFDESGIMGIVEILKSIVKEITGIADKLNGRIADLQKEGGS